MDKIYRTCLYGRTSKDDEKTCSIENQMKRLRQWAVDDPLVDKSSIGEFWDADVSGKIPLSERPAGKRMLEAIQHGEFDSVAVVFADRFGRTLLDGLQAAAELEKKGVKLVTIDEGWDARKDSDPFFFQMRLLLAEQEHRRIVDRFRRGKERSMDKNDAPPLGTLTYGYRFDERGRYVVCPEEAAIVVEVFERFLKDDTLREIARWMKSKGVKAGCLYQKREKGSEAFFRKDHEDAKLDESKVRRILKNRTYIGERKWGKRTFPCPPLVSISCFDAVQRLLEDNHDGRNELRGDPAHGLVSALLTCGLCGKKVYAENEKQNKPSGVYRYRKYICQGSRDGSKCKCKKLPQDKLDTAVWDLVQSYLWNPGELLAKVAESDRSLNQSSDELLAAEAAHRERMDGINTEVQKVWQKQRENNWPVEWVEPQLNALNVQRQQAQAELNKARRSHADQTQDQDKLRELQSSLVSIRLRLIDGLTAAEKRHILELLIASAVVQTEGTGRGKKGELILGLRWGDFITTESAKGLPLANMGVVTISFRVAV